MRKRLDDLDRALDQHVGPAAVIPGDAADHDTENKADRDTDQPDRQRDARTVNDARQEIAAEPVAAEQEHRRPFRRAHQVPVTADQTPGFIAVAAAEKPDRLALV